MLSIGVEGKVSAIKMMLREGGRKKKKRIGGIGD